jgi:hypothetical protein
MPNNFVLSRCVIWRKKCAENKRTTAVIESKKFVPWKTSDLSFAFLLEKTNAKSAIPVKTTNGESISILKKKITELKTEESAIDKKKLVSPRAIEPLIINMNAKNRPNRMADGKESRIA